MDRTRRPLRVISGDRLKGNVKPETIFKHALQNVEQLYKATVVRKTVDETVNNSITLQNDDALLWAVNINEVWAFHAFVRYTSGATPDIKFGWSYPTGTTMSWQPRYAVTATAGLTEVTETGVLAIPCDDTNQLLAFEGVVIVSTTSGTITLQWAQNTANASDTKVLANSYIVLDELT